MSKIYISDHQWRKEKRKQRLKNRKKNRPKPRPKIKGYDRDLELEDDGDDYIFDRYGHRR